jgi:transposase
VCHGADLRCARADSTAAGTRLPGAALVISLPTGTRIWLAAGVTDLRRGMDGLATLVQVALAENVFAGDLFIFRGRRGDLVKLLWWSGDGMNLYAKRLERGRFVWPQATSGAVHLSNAQLSMLLEGIDWRRPTTTWQPQQAA